jgi:hypothetical protein
VKTQQTKSFGLLNMSPGFSLQNFSYRSICGSKSFGNSFLLLTVCPKFSNFPYFPLVKNSVPTSNTHNATPFGNHVFSILFCRSQKQVIRIYASRIIAFVTNIKTIWNWAKMDRPRNPIGPKSLFGSNSYISVTLSCASNPKPAWTEFWTAVRNGAVFINFFPKSVFKWTGSVICHLSTYDFTVGVA